MELTLLTIPGCPHREAFEQRLAQALAGRAVTIVRHEVNDAAQARRLGLHGSPTLLIDGTDPFAAPGEPTGVWCRLYRLPDGSTDGAPSVDQLRAALNGPAASGWTTVGSVPRSSRGWSLPLRAAESRLKRAADGLRSRSGRPLAARYAMVIALIALAAPLPVRGTLIVAALAAAAAGGWCAVNFWRCGHAHYAATGGGWLALALFSVSEAAEAADDRSVIDGHEGIVLLAILALAVTLETLWCTVRHANAVCDDRSRPQPGRGR
ncbi:MAG TPA: hypothetical protein VH594_24260 [Trebonia sp.]|jgi:hypothetical protein